MPVLSADRLRRISRSIFESAGAPREEARLVASLLVKANLQGHDSHGVIRIAQYVRDISEGKIRPGVEIAVAKETPTTAVVDGNWGFGQCVAEKSMQIAIRKAERYGLGAVTVFNCNHVGRLWDYTTMALDHDMIGFAAANGGRIVAPFGGLERMLHTAPISFAVPTGRERPFVLDMATSVVAEGKLYVAMHKKARVPDGWIIDREGRPSNDPADYFAGGALLPLGGPVAGYKGFGLGLVVDVLGGILSGAGAASSREYKGGNGLFLAAIGIDHFAPIEEFKQRMDRLITAIKSSRKAPGYAEILIPGEVELRTEERRLKEGIEIPDRTWEEMARAAETLGLDIGAIA